MPVYVYRCLDCGLSVDVRHGFDETYGGDCQGCGGVVRKYFGHVQFAPSATPSRGNIDWGVTKRNEKTKKQTWQRTNASALRGYNPFY